VAAIGLAASDIEAFLPFRVKAKEAEHISAYFKPEKAGSPVQGIGPADVHNRAPRPMPLVAAGARVIGDGVMAVAGDGNVVFFQMAPWQYDYRNNFGLKRTYRRASFTVNRLLANMGAAGETPLLDRFSKPLGILEKDNRWAYGFYLDQYEEMDDPYRFFRW
jgi:hypothetical protein